MKIGKHRGREIRLAEHSRKFEVGSGADAISTFDSYDGAVAFIDKEAAMAAKGRKLALEAIGLAGGLYSSGDRAPVDVVVTGINRGHRGLTMSGVPAGKEVREVYVRHAVVRDLHAEQRELQRQVSAVGALLGKLRIPDFAGHGRIETVEEYDRLITEIEQRHAAALILADEIAKQRAAPSVPSAEIVPARGDQASA